MKRKTKPKQIRAADSVKNCNPLLERCSLVRDRNRPALEVPRPVWPDQREGFLELGRRSDLRASYKEFSAGKAGESRTACDCP